jgi:hypothetical protein
LSLQAIIISALVNDNYLTVSKPIPLFEPVTIITYPFKFFIVNYSLGELMKNLIRKNISIIKEILTLQAIVLFSAVIIKKNK